MKSNRHSSSVKFTVLQTSLLLLIAWHPKPVFLKLVLGEPQAVHIFAQRQKYVLSGVELGGSKKVDPLGVPEDRVGKHCHKLYFHEVPRPSLMTLPLGSGDVLLL